MVTYWELFLVLHGKTAMNNKNYYSNQKLIKMKLSEILTKEINSYDSVEPNVKIFVDESAYFWATKEGEFIWLQDHKGLSGPDFLEIDDPDKDWNPDFVDEVHKATEEKTPEGVGNYGVYWMNQDFESPFHISDFITRISEITEPDLQDELISELKEDEKTPA